MCSVKRILFGLYVGLIVGAAVAALSMLLSGCAMAAERAVQPPARSRLVIVGRTGMGKSVFGEQYEKRIRRIVKVDALHELELGGGVVDADEFCDRAAAGEYR